VKGPGPGINPSVRSIDDTRVPLAGVDGGGFALGGVTAMMLKMNCS
jgi:hypothetical protein